MMTGDAFDCVPISTTYYSPGTGSIRTVATQTLTNKIVQKWQVAAPPRQHGKPQIVQGRTDRPILIEEKSQFSEA